MLQIVLCGDARRRHACQTRTSNLDLAKDRRMARCITSTCCVFRKSFLCSSYLSSPSHVCGSLKCGNQTANAVLCIRTTSVRVQVWSMSRMLTYFYAATSPLPRGESTFGNRKSDLNVPCCTRVSSDCVRVAHSAKMIRLLAAAAVVAPLPSRNG
jgi:hypothetical protein